MKKQECSGLKNKTLFYSHYLKGKRNKIGNSLRVKVKSRLLPVELDLRANFR